MTFQIFPTKYRHFTALGNFSRIISKNTNLRIFIITTGTTLMPHTGYSKKIETRFIS